MLEITWHRVDVIGRYDYGKCQPVNVWPSLRIMKIGYEVSWSIPVEIMLLVREMIDRYVCLISRYVYVGSIFSLLWCVCDNSSMYVYIHQVVWSLCVVGFPSFINYPIGKSMFANLGWGASTFCNVVGHALYTAHFNIGWRGSNSTMLAVRLKS